MTNKQKIKRYTVGAVLTLWVGTEISAASLEEAAALSKNLQIDDFVTILDHEEYNDGRMKIIQVFDPDFDIRIAA